METITEFTSANVRELCNVLQHEFSLIGASAGIDIILDTISYQAQRCHAQLTISVSGPTTKEQRRNEHIKKLKANLHRITYAHYIRRWSGSSR